MAITRRKMEQNFVTFETGEVDIGSKQDELRDKQGDFWDRRS